MTTATALKLDFNNMLGKFPVSEPQNLINTLDSSRLEPLRSYTQSQSIKFMGDVKTPAFNQAVQGGVNIINPQIQTVRQIPYVSDRRRIPVKTENRRKDKVANEALWDIRNNMSLNNANKVPGNYYSTKLAENAKSKIRMTNTADAMRTQYSGDREDYITGNSSVDNSFIPTQKYSSEGFDLSDTGTLNFYDLINDKNSFMPGSSSNFGTGSRIKVEETSYNPYLPQSKLFKNLSDPTGDKVAYPDERMTRYSGERQYMTKADRSRMASDLAHSDLLKERRELQNQAYNKLMGIARAPRMLGADIANGINTTNTYNAIGMKQQLRQNEGYWDNPNKTNEIKDRGLKIANVRDEGILVPKFEQDDFYVNENSEDKILDIKGNRLNENITGVDDYNKNKMKYETYIPRNSDISSQSSIQQAIDTYYTPGIEKIKGRITDADIVRKIYAEQFGNNQKVQKENDNIIYNFINNVKGWLGFKNESSESSENETFLNRNFISEDSRRKEGNISAKTFENTIKQLSELLKDDSLSLHSRQAFNKDLREQAKEYLDDYNDNIHQDLLIRDLVNDIAERCVIKDTQGKRIGIDEDKFIDEISKSSQILERMDELKIRTSKNIMNADKQIYLRNVCEQYDANIIFNWLLDVKDEFEEYKKYGDRLLKRNNLDKVQLYYTTRGVKEEYDKDLKSKRFEDVEKPVMILTTDGHNLIRNVVIRDNNLNKYILLQRRENTDLDEDSYLLLDITPEELQDLLDLDSTKLKIKEDTRKGANEGIVNLTFEEHVKLVNFVESIKNKDIGIISSKKPIHPYQRDILDNNEVAADIGVISNIELGADSTFDKSVRKNQNVKGHVESYENLHNALNNQNGTIKNMNIVKSERGFDERTKLEHNVITEMDPKKMYKRFGDML